MLEKHQRQEAVGYEMCEEAAYKLRSDFRRSNQGTLLYYEIQSRQIIVSAIR